MRYLLHHTDASYNSVTKKWIVTTDRRVSNPTSIRIASCTFTAATASSYPSVVYMRSDALTQLSRTKHTVELKAVDHEDNSNVIAVLQETHTLGRYATKDAVRFPVHGHTQSTRIDIYFTDGTTIMAGEVASDSPASGLDADIVAIDDDILAWFDMAPGRSMSRMRKRRRPRTP